MSGAPGGHSRELWLLRHGQTDWNQYRRWQGHTDIPLNAEGMKQAGRTALRLRAERFDAVYASDLGRARMTAKLACPDAPLILEPRLREVRFGIMEGKSWDDMTAEEQGIVSAWWRRPYENRLPDGESMQDLHDRLVAWRSELPAHGRFLVVTHGGPIRCLLWETLGRPRDRDWTITLDNCGLTRVIYGDGFTTIVTVNDCGHLFDAV